MQVTNIENAYLEAKTSEKVYIIAGPEYEEKTGVSLNIHKALHGLSSSGQQWHMKLSDDLRDMGLFSCKVEPDISMRKSGSLQEYIAVYVDDLTFVVQNPEKLVKELEYNQKYKLKVTGSISYHFGCDFFIDEDGNLCIAPRN